MACEILALFKLSFTFNVLTCIICKKFSAEISEGLEHVMFVMSGGII